MERKKFWAPIGVSTGWSLTIFGAIILFNNWGPPSGWFIFGLGIVCWCLSYCLAIQYDCSLKSQDKK